MHPVHSLVGRYVTFGRSDILLVTAEEVGDLVALTNDLGTKVWTNRCRLVWLVSVL